MEFQQIIQIYLMWFMASILLNTIILAVDSIVDNTNSINKIVSTNYSISETIFTELYSFIQLMEMTKNEEEIYKLDYSLVENKGKKDV